mmetsp:Transcript_58259/g.189913  ORF Transcript_58259/g.189913 Transcript_58259/m.189913 type:complete len:550 (-) Transcript_58259:90-1739(-)
MGATSSADGAAPGPGHGASSSSSSWPHALPSAPPPAGHAPTAMASGSSASLSGPPGASFSHFSMRRSTSMFSEKIRKVCPHGVACYRRNPAHNNEFAHPADHDYLEACRLEDRDPEFISIFSLFLWCDKDGSGKAGREEMQNVWPKLQALSPSIGALDDKLWLVLDDDGNGYVNFSEFAEFTTKNKVNLPLGLDSLLGEATTNSGASLRCGVVNCFCTTFTERRARCKYGATCYQKSPDHKKNFAHPGEPDWEASKAARYAEMCSCGHKKKLHASSATGSSTVDYPSYWTMTSGGEDEFNSFVPVDVDFLEKFQNLVDWSYSDVTTRDRLRHGGSWMVPRDFRVTSCLRNENSKLWRKYTYAKKNLQKEKELTIQNPEIAAQLPDYSVVDDVVTTKAWEASHGEALDEHVNEWYLWHGTSRSAAENICNHDFKLCLAGLATGTLYGRGTYFAESITKADEYARVEDGNFTVLLCRVLGGRVRRCDVREPDAEQLTLDCVEGPYDCVVGDRRKVSGTYREFVIFDAENVYPEYVLSYTRGELFKSPSHPS